MRHKFPAILFCLLFITNLLSGCGNGKIALSEEQEAKIDIIIQNVDQWGESYLDSGTYWPMNRIYLSELENGATLLTVGYKGPPTLGQLADHSSVSSSIYLGVHTYVITEDFSSVGGAYKSEVGNWSLNGATIELESMSNNELKDSLEQLYLKFLKSK